MMTESEARARVVAGIGVGPVVTVPLAEAGGRWAAMDVRARVALPGFDNSAMDGYALHERDCGQTDRWLEVAGEIQAGQAPEAQGPSVGPGRVVRLFTGAPLPPGTSAVVMQEDVEVEEAPSHRLRVRVAAGVGEFIRRRGADVTPGQRVIAAGDPLTPARIGLLASQGWATAAVRPRPRLCVLTTGDELVTPGTDLPHAAALYNSNGPMLAALAQTAGAVVTLRHVHDDLAAVTAALQEALALGDIVVVAGGVSVGRHDHVKPALAALGWKPDLWRVALKPGKPFLFASQGARAVFGLPGNPVSAFVTFHLFVAPALRCWQGAGAAGSTVPSLPTRLAAPVENRGDRPHYLRGRLDEDGSFRPDGLQESHALFSLSRATALLGVPPGEAWPVGREVRVHPL